MFSAESFGWCIHVLFSNDWVLYVCYSFSKCAASPGTAMCRRRSWVWCFYFTLSVSLLLFHSFCFTPVSFLLFYPFSVTLSVHSFYFTPSVFILAIRLLICHVHSFYFTHAASLFLLHSFCFTPVPSSSTFCTFSVPFCPLSSFHYLLSIVLSWTCCIIPSHYRNLF